MQGILDLIEASLASVNGVESALEVASEKSGQPTPVKLQIAWIERQLAMLVNKLQAMQEDLAAGLGLAEMGFADPEELQDFLQDVAIQIAQLKSLAQALSKGIGRDF